MSRNGTDSSTHWRDAPLGEVLRNFGELCRELATQAEARARLRWAWWKQRNRMPWWLPDRVLGDVWQPVREWNWPGPLDLEASDFGLNSLHSRLAPTGYGCQGYHDAALDRPARIDVAALLRTQVSPVRGGR